MKKIFFLLAIAALGATGCRTHDDMDSNGYQQNNSQMESNTNNSSYYNNQPSSGSMNNNQ